MTDTGLSGCAYTGAQRMRGRDAQVGSLRSGSLLKLMQRVGIDSDVQAHLRSVGGRGDGHGLGLVEQPVKLVGRDLVVVLHRYIMLI